VAFLLLPARVEARPGREGVGEAGGDVHCRRDADAAGGIGFASDRSRVTATMGLAVRVQVVQQRPDLFTGGGVQRESAKWRPTPLGSIRVLVLLLLLLLLLLARNSPVICKACQRGRI
jgi:hypothetical protein